MKIALDFDNTITADPSFWSEFARLAIAHGHEVTVVTSRYPGNPVPVVGLPVVYCSFTAKRNPFQSRDVPLLQRRPATSRHMNQLSTEQKQQLLKLNEQKRRIALNSILVQWKNRTLEEIKTA